MQYGKEELLSMLAKIDQEASLTFGTVAKKLPVVIVGGSAFLLHDLTNRPTTRDVDVLAHDDALRDILSNYHAVNAAVTAYIDQVPYNFEERLVHIDLKTETVEFLTPSFEDLAIMKLYGWRPNDQVDLENPAFLERVDWDALDNLVYNPDEARASALSDRRYKEMVSTYEEYSRRNGHEPNA